MSDHDPDARLAEVLGVSVEDPEHLRRALIHRSYAFEEGGVAHNERLEFLGDAVLGLVVTDLVFRSEPEAAEGRLAKLRAVAVSEPSLAAIARKLDLGSLVKLGRGEDASGGRDKDSILADALEAVIGAVYLDQGLEVADSVVRPLFEPVMADIAARPEAVDPKTALQELLAGQGRSLPRYHLTDTGPDHAKQFRAEVWVEGQCLGEGSGRNKKEAEQGAAAQAVRRLRAADRDGEPPLTGSADVARPDGVEEGEAR